MRIKGEERKEVLVSLGECLQGGLSFNIKKSFCPIPVCEGLEGIAHNSVLCPKGWEYLSFAAKILS